LRYLQSEDLEERIVQRTVVVFVTVVMAVASGTALAANGIKCPNRDGDRCVGTAQPDEMVGSRGDDTIRGRAGADTIRGRGGSDELHGEIGGDTIVAARCGLPRGPMSLPGAATTTSRSPATAATWLSCRRPIGSTADQATTWCAAWFRRTGSTKTASG
jgi:Ca2+-binding RTX toxin-like protein